MLLSQWPGVIFGFVSPDLKQILVPYSLALPAHILHTVGCLISHILIFLGFQYFGLHFYLFIFRGSSFGIVGEYRWLLIGFAGY